MPNTYEIDPSRVFSSPPGGPSSREVDPTTVTTSPPPRFLSPTPSVTPVSTPYTDQAMDSMSDLERLAAGMPAKHVIGEQPVPLGVKIGVPLGTGIRMAGGGLAMLPAVGQVTSGLAATIPGAIPAAAAGVLANAAVGAGITGSTDVLAQLAEYGLGARPSISGKEAMIAAGAGAIPLGRLAQLRTAPKLALRALQGAGISLGATEAQQLWEQGKVAGTREAIQSLLLGGAFGGGGGLIESRAAIPGLRAVFPRPPIAAPATLRMA